MIARLIRASLANRFLVLLATAMLAVAGLFNIFFAILPGPLVSVATAAAKSLF